MNEHNTARGDGQIEKVIQAYLDYLEGTGPEPLLDGMDEDERCRATALIESLRAGRGIDPYASRPPTEALLAGSEFETALTATSTQGSFVDLTNLCGILSASAPRAQASTDTASDGTETVVFDYIDLRARFVLVDGGTPLITDQVRSMAQRLLDRDPSTSYVGVVARQDPELATQLLSAADLGKTVTVPNGDAQAGRLPALPLRWAARQVLEQGAPEWEPFSLEQGDVVALDVPAVATEIARQIIEREASRPYRGDKSLAYKSLAGHESEFSELVVQVATQGAGAVDLEADTSRMAQDAA